jgi:hypothetical protein
MQNLKFRKGRGKDLNENTMSYAKPEIQNRKGTTSQGRHKELWEM